VAEPSNIEEVTKWYEAYFDVLAHLGFSIQDWGFSEYSQSSQDFEAHEAVLDIAGVLLAGAPSVLAVLESTLGVLRETAENNSWISLFNRETNSANTARFQIALVNEDENGQLLVSLMAFGMHAESKLTQVLFFKFHSNEVTFNHYSGQVTIATDVLDGVRSKVAGKLIAFTSSYIEGLPDLSG
jgi:hypothetical protein